VLGKEKEIEELVADSDHPQAGGATGGGSRQGGIGDSVGEGGKGAADRSQGEIGKRASTSAEDEDGIKQPPLYYSNNTGFDQVASVPNEDRARASYSGAAALEDLRSVASFILGGLCCIGWHLGWPSRAPNGCDGAYSEMEVLVYDDWSFDAVAPASTRMSVSTNSSPHMVSIASSLVW